MGEYVLSDDGYLNDRDHQTLAEDVAYRTELEDAHPVVLFRPGDRSNPGAQYVTADESGHSYIALILKYGSHEEQVPPTLEEPRIPIKILSRTAKTIREITPQEYASAYTEIHDEASLIRWLQKKYPQYADSFTSNSIITVYQIDYV